MGLPMKTLPRPAFLEVTAGTASTIHELYKDCPSYFQLIGMGVPDLLDVERELEALGMDPYRRAHLLEVEGEVLGYVDYKMAYPETDSATISLLLIKESRQGQGLGKLAARGLEAELSGKVSQLYAVVYGNNQKARGFWQSLGYTHLRDGGPSLGWYSKSLV